MMTLMLAADEEQLHHPHPTSALTHNQGQGIARMELSIQVQVGTIQATQQELLLQFREEASQIYF